MANTKWHPAFCAAMRLELKDSRMLQFTDDFHLSEEPLRVDLLIIHKPSDVRIDNQIGEFFDEHNLLEYKSPTDRNFNEYGMFQALAYAYYYYDRYKTKDITLSLVVSKSHFNMMKWLDKQGIKYSKRHDGIYTLEGISFLEKVQVVVTEEINSDLFIWLSSLTDKLTESKARNFVKTAYELAENENKRLAEAIVQVLASANGALFKKMKEDEIMASTLMELMRPEVERYAEDFAEKYAESRIRENDIKRVKAMIKHGDDNEYIKLIMDMSDSEIDELRRSM